MNEPLYTARAAAQALHRNVLGSLGESETVQANAALYTIEIHQVAATVYKMLGTETSDIQRSLAGALEALDDAARDAAAVAWGPHRLTYAASGGLITHIQRANRHLSHAIATRRGAAAVRQRGM